MAPRVSRPVRGQRSRIGRHDVPADPSEGLEHLDMVPGDVAHHHVLEAHRTVLSQLLHHRFGSANEQRVPARPAIALGEDRVHHRGRFGVAVADEDVAAQHGQSPATGASRRLAIRLELFLQVIRWSVLAREPAVTEPSRALGGSPHGARNPERNGHARQRADLRPLDSAIAAMEGDALAGQEGAENADQLLEPADAALLLPTEGAEGLGAAAERQGHDERSLRERRQCPDLLRQHDGLVEGGEEDHADRHVAGDGHEPRERGDGGETVGVGGRHGVVVAHEQAVEAGGARGRRHLSQLRACSAVSYAPIGRSMKEPAGAAASVRLNASWVCGEVGKRKRKDVPSFMGAMVCHGHARRQPRKTSSLTTLRGRA